MIGSNIFLLPPFWPDSFFHFTLWLYSSMITTLLCEKVNVVWSSGNKPVIGYDDHLCYLYFMWSLFVPISSFVGLAIYAHVYFICLCLFLLWNEKASLTVTQHPRMTKGNLYPDLGYVEWKYRYRATIVDKNTYLVLWEQRIGYSQWLPHAFNSPH